MQYLTSFDYFPRNDCEMAERSRIICGNIKGGREVAINHRIDRIILSGEIITPFLNDEITLVPVPRSSPIIDGAVWPAGIICNLLLQRGLAMGVSNLVQRIYPLRKASLQHSADQRPSVREHYESITVNNVLNRPNQITLVDDVLTQGRTSYACYLRLNEVFPEAEIRLFAIARSRSFINSPVDDIFNVTVGEIIYNTKTGKTRTEP